jgi:hypothetical protein
LVLPPRLPVGSEPLRLAQRRGAFQAQERASVKKLLAYEKEVNEGFAKTAA